MGVHDEAERAKRVSAQLGNFLMASDANMSMTKLKSEAGDDSGDIIKGPKLGNEPVTSKLIKNYSDMVEGGRVYDREGANNKMPLRHVLMITKQIIEEHAPVSYTHLTLPTICSV